MSPRFCPSAASARQLRWQQTRLSVDNPSSVHSTGACEAHHHWIHIRCSSNEGCLTRSNLALVLWTSPGLPEGRSTPGILVHLLMDLSHRKVANCWASPFTMHLLPIIWRAPLQLPPHDVSQHPLGSLSCLPHSRIAIELPW